MATHSSVLAWRISGTVEPGGLPSTGSYRVRYNWSGSSSSSIHISPPSGASLPPPHPSPLGHHRAPRWVPHAIEQLPVSYLFYTWLGLPWWLSGKELTYQCRKHGLDPWIRKIPWRRERQPTPVFLPGKSHGQRSLLGYSPWGHKRVGHDLATKQQQVYIFQCYSLNLSYPLLPLLCP